MIILFDYAPAIIQFGRAVESEIMNFFKKVKDSIILNSTYNSWVSNYNNQIRSSGITISQKHQFKNYIDKDKLSFGDSNHIFQLMSTEDTVNINKVGLLKKLNECLEVTFFNNWNDSLKSKMILLPDIIKGRNEAAHTYSLTDLPQEKMITYRRKVEEFLITWNEGMK
jgi:hypothetical protein